MERNAEIPVLIAKTKKGEISYNLPSFIKNNICIVLHSFIDYIYAFICIFMTKNLLTISEAAAIMRVSIDTLRRWDASGKLVAVRLSSGAHRRYRLEDIQIFMRDVSSLARKWVLSDMPEEPDAEYYAATSAHFQARLSSMEKNLQRGFPEMFSLITSVAGEIGNNSFDHNLGNWPDVSGIFFAYDIPKRVVVLADRGQGVRSTLQRVLPELKTDREALRVAFTEIITGRAPEHRGNGLKYVRKVITESQMKLLFQTGDAVLQLQRERRSLTIKKADRPFRGCLAIIRF